MEAKLKIEKIDVETEEKVWMRGEDEILKGARGGKFSDKEETGIDGKFAATCHAPT